MPALSFSFSKKAEPKRVVAALSTKPKPDEGKEVITSLEEGEVKIDGAVKEAKALTIPCKNPLEAQRAAAAAKLKKQEAERAAPDAPAAKPPPIDEQQGGLIKRNMEKLSDDDAEAMRELLKDASREEGGGDDSGFAMELQPILMREGSKRVRDGDAADVSRDTFEKMPVEAFGMALLRGMGYNPETHKTKPVYHERPRDNLLGLGAKALLPSEKMGAAKKKAAPAAASAAKAAKEPVKEEPPEKRQRQETNGSAAEDKKKKDDLWPSRGLVVRIIGQSPDLKDFFGAEGVVLEADPASWCCKVKARSSAGGKSQVLSGVKVSDIETRVSRDCKSVRIVRGANKGLVAKLLQRDTKNGIAQVELEGTEQKLSLDDVCQYMA